MRSVLFLVLSAVTLLAGCTAEQRYASAQGWQRNQCARIPDKTEYDRCMASTAATYDEYQRQK